jgi:MscS family membrane protein
MKQRAAATQTQIDDILLRSVGRPVVLLGTIGGIALGREALTPVEPLRSALHVSVRIPVVVSLAWIAVRLTDGFIESYAEAYADRTESKLDDELVPIVGRITNIAIITTATIVVLDSVGYDVTAVVASLGIGGIAVAFASRKTMADVFGGAHILATKPFVVGDTVDIDGTAGTVEEVGLRTTRLRDFDGRIVTLPNASIAGAEITNLTSEPTRRVKTFVGLPYTTTPAEMATALDLAAETAATVDGVDPERTGAWFWEYGDTSLRIRLEYHIEARDRWKAVRDRVNRDVQAAFADTDLELTAPVGGFRLGGNP